MQVKADHARNKFARQVKGIMFAGLIAVMVSACGQSEKASDTSPAPESTIVSPSKAVGNPTAAEAPTPTPASYSYTYPLTGLGTNEKPQGRPIMVMVENSAAARPQSGLDQADLVYEILAEGEITRFAAFFESKTPTIIGPVRSIRPYFVQLGEGLDAVIVHAGWSQEAMNLLAGHKLDHLDQVYGDEKYYWRDSSRKMPHNLYTSIEKIKKGEKDKNFREAWHGPSLHFMGAGEAVVGKPADSVDIEYLRGYHVSYQYDVKTGVYARFMNGEPHLDKEDGKQITAANVLIIRTSHRFVDSYGRRAVNVIGPGTGYLLQKGIMQEITWQNKDGVIRPYVDGKEVLLVPGTTWVQVVEEQAKVQFP